MVNVEDDHALLKSDGMAAPLESKASSSSSSSGYSSDEDFIQFDANDLKNPASAGTDEVVRTSSDAAGPGAYPALSMQSQMAGPNPLPSSYGTRLTADEFSQVAEKQPPTTQVMARSDVPDPSRIPPSIFERSKSTTPIEWSVASNESLFSIHGGNSSFSRDHVFLLERSGELPNFSGSPFDAYPLPGPAAPEPNSRVPDMRNDQVKQAAATEAANAEAMRHVMTVAADGNAGKQNPPVGGLARSSSISGHSDASNQSFAFPILDGGRSGSVKLDPRQEPHVQVDQQQAKAEDSTTPQEPPLEGTQTSWFSCCACSFCR